MLYRQETYIRHGRFLEPSIFCIYIVENVLAIICVYLVHQNEHHQIRFIPFACIKQAKGSNFIPGIN